jgi:uncharacterized membrane protein (DUF2068 family)
MSSEPEQPVEVLNPAPTLYVIIAMKVMKGALFIALAISLWTLSDNDLPADYQQALHRLNHWNHHINPESKFWVDLSIKVGDITQAGMQKAAIGTLIYSLFAVVESVGLMFRVSWAGWLSIGESVFFIPIEVFELIHNFTWSVFGILIFNIGMVWYLFQNRDRLFHHHHHHHHLRPSAPIPPITPVV